MKEMIIRWILNQRISFFVSFAFGLLATLAYLVAGYTSGGGRLGLWYVLYFISWPISWVMNQITARLEGHIPDWLFGFCYAAGMIVSGMIWFFVICILIRYSANKIRMRGV